jgi:uracil-DNA glycosylase family protein
MRLFDEDHQPAPVPPGADTVEELRAAAAGCQACPLWENATQTVFGEGPPGADVMFVGEQPGDQEDLEGEPFVGPAGRVLDEALEAVGLDRTAIYVTNTVKHFKWQPRGKRRIHQKPNAAEQAACRPWLNAELAVVQPEALVVLGATAAQALLGAGFSVTKQRGLVPEGGPPGVATVATVHPSSILRAPDEQRRQAMDDFVADLRVAAGVLARA